MAIYVRCIGCKRDYRITVKVCSNCGKALGKKYKVRVQDAATKKWRTKQVDSLSLARKVEGKFKVQMVEGKLFDLKKANSFNFNSYLQYAKMHKKTWKDDQRRWKNHVEGKDHRTASGIQKILNDMEGFSPASKRHVFTLVRRVYNWHIQQDLWHQQNPARNIRLPKFDNRMSNVLTTEQLQKLIDFLKSWENRRASLPILFAIYTGRRKGEIMNLEWSDVSHDLQFITCRNTKNGETISFPLNSSAMEVLKEARSVRVTQRYVFSSPSGKCYYEGFNSAWKRLKKRLTVEGILDLSSIRFHDLRHTYASHLASSGKVDIYTLKTLLGHKDIALTERYSHLSNERLRRSTEVLDSIL